MGGCGGWSERSRTVCTWLVVGAGGEPGREDILKDLEGRYADFDLADRPHVSLEWKDDRLLLKTKEPDRLFDWIARKRVYAFVLAPSSELCHFDQKLIRHKGRRYIVSRCRDQELPYYRRLIDIELYDFQVAPDTELEEHE